MLPPFLRYFHPNGKPNLKFITAQTAAMALLVINCYEYSIFRVRDNTMLPFLTCPDKYPNLAWLISDRALYKHIDITVKTNALKNKLVVIKNP